MNSMDMNKLVKWFYIFFFILSLFITLSIISVLPQNPLSPDKSKSVAISQILPQGWGFYSKDPREEYLNIYSEDGETSAQWPNMSLSNLFGVNRFGRAQGTELGLIIAALKETDFKECYKEIDDCIADMEKVEPIVKLNSTPKKTFCGIHYIAFQEPMPWAWSSSNERTYKSSRIAKVLIKCQRN